MLPKKGYTKKACERYQNLSKEEKEKSENIYANDIKISLKMKSEDCLSIEKNYFKKWKNTSW